MSLLREIQAAATESSADIGTALRKAKILAVRLQSDELKTWADRELNGYAENEAIPSYRTIHTSAFANIKRGHETWSEAPVFENQLPENLRVWANTAYLRHPISVYSDLLTRDKDKGHFVCPWPQELAYHYGAKGYLGFECLGAWQRVEFGALIALVETVRNRLLDFALAIEGRDPQAGETTEQSVSLPKEFISQTVNMTILGGNNNIAAGSHGFAQHLNVAAGDFDGLIEYLHAVLPNHAVANLKEVGEATGDKRSAVKQWLGDLTLSSAKDITKAGIEIAATAVKAYLGM